MDLVGRIAIWFWKKLRNEYEWLGYQELYLGCEMNTNEYICICLAFPSSGIYLIKPQRYKNVRWHSHFC